MARGLTKNGISKKKWEQQRQDYVRSTAVLIGRAMVHPLGSMVHFWDYGPRHDITPKSDQSGPTELATTVLCGSST